MIRSIRFNQNKDEFEILNIKGSSKENENDIPFFEAQDENENINITLESNNNLLNNIFPIFEPEEKGNLNNEIEEEIGPTITEQLFFIKNTINANKSLKKRFKITKKKRGREKLKQVKIKTYENEKVHDKNTSDNLLRKIQVHYISFIVKFLNEILQILNYKQRFLKLCYRFKRNIKKGFVNSLKVKSIGDIICNPISKQYKKDLNYNMYIFEQVKEDKVLKKIFSENYTSFFRKIYFKSRSIINLREYGLNKAIILPDKIKMYKDLLKNEEYTYKRNMNNCINHHFFPNSIFNIE